MTKVPIRKAKRVVLTKRSQCLGKHYKKRSYRSLYEQLKSNNRYLAKTLSQEKQNNQSLFTQNLELITEIQQLNLACNTRSTVISNVLNNTKEVLKMLVTMTGYMTNTISMCQELATSNTVRMLSSSAGRKESSKRLSTKSPAKGVVKPMVGGHTITKPTINLSRVNMESINNISRLSDIQEESTPNRSQENRSPIVVPLPSTPIRYENDRRCRLPERLTITTPRVNVVEEQRLERRRSYTKRLTGSYSRRWSDKTSNISPACINIINNRVSNIENQENNDNTPHEPSDKNVMRQAMQMSINSNEEDEMHMPKKDHNIRMNGKTSDKDFSRNVMRHSRLSQNNTRSWEEEDPLEGPSWLFNNTVPSRDNEPEELDHLHISDVNNNTSQLMMYDNDSSNTESNAEELQSLPNINESVSDTQSSGKDLSPTVHRNEYESYLDEHDANGSFCGILPTTVVMSNRERNLDNTEDSTTNFASFVTLRRGHSEVSEETEDFTLMLSHQPRQSDIKFDIKELQLPVLEDSIINSTIDTDEVNTAIPTVTSNRNMNEIYDEITNKLPLILINDRERVSTSQQKKHLNKKNKKAKTSNSKNGMNPGIKNTLTGERVKAKQRKSDNNRDPSAAKVVLEKLNEYYVKPKTSSANDTESRNSNNTKDSLPNEEENLQNSRSDMNDSCGSTRPRRRKAPINLKEPNLNKKLRREN